MLPIAVLAGGFGTRLGGLTTNTPKALIEIRGRAFIDLQMDLLIRSGYRRIVYCVSHLSDLVIQHLENVKHEGVEIAISIDGKNQLGTGGAIRKALEKLGDKFAVIYGDSYLPFDFGSMEREFLKSNSQAMMSIYLNQNKFDKSNVRYLEGNKIEYSKNSDRSEFKYIDYGLTYFLAEPFRTYELNETFDLAKLFSDLSRRKSLTGHEVYDRFFEIGSVQGIQDLNEYLENFKQQSTQS